MLYQAQHFGISEYFHRESGKNFSFPLHMHHSFEFITILDGSMTVTIGNEQYDLQKNEGILIFPEQLHSLESTESEHLLFIFSPDIISAFYSKRSTSLPQCAKIQIPPYLLSQITELDEHSSKIKTKGVLYLLCALLDERTEYVKRKAVENGLLRAVFDFVESNFDKSCTLDDLSGAVGYNRCYLSRYFSESTGMTFISYVNQYRISRACDMLKNSAKTVLECAYDCGYTSLRSFNRNFKLYIGIAPKDYRAGE
jgi:AraC-like DNA-binding protein